MKHSADRVPGVAPAPQIWRGACARLTVGLLLLVATVAYGALAVATVLPDTAAELGGLARYGRVFSAFMRANLLGVVGAGWAIDRAGTAPTLVGAGLGALVTPVEERTEVTAVPGSAGGSRSLSRSGAPPLPRQATRWASVTPTAAPSM